MSINKLKPETTFQCVLGQVIVKIRKELQIEQSSLAIAVGVTQSTWSRIERGESSLNIDQLVNAANCLRVKASTIILEAEDATVTLQQQGVIVRTDKAVSSKANTGMALIGAAALGALVATAIAKSNDSDT